MIEIEGMYVFDISVGKFKNFLDWSDLTKFSLFEEAGCVLPQIDLIFKFKIAELRNYLTENNVISITVGTSRDDMQTFPFRIKEKLFYYSYTKPGNFIPYLARAASKIICTNSGWVMPSALPSMTRSEISGDNPGSGLISRIYGFQLSLTSKRKSTRETSNASMTRNTAAASQLSSSTISSSSGAGQR